MVSIAVVGAGVAGSAAAFTIDRGFPDTTITILEKSGGLGGRAATRRRGDITYDYGANYVKSKDEVVVELLTETLDDNGLVDIVEPVHGFDESGTISPGNDRNEHKWTYRSGITQIAKRLLENTNVNVHRQTRVQSITYTESEWLLEDGEGKRWGPYDYLLLNPPAPQTATLVMDADWDSEHREDLVQAIEATEYRTIWTAILHYPFEVDRPYYALVNSDKEHPVGWIAREECKPGHVPDDESLLIIQANHDWSIEHFDDPPAENRRSLAAFAADLMNDERLTDPDWTDHQGWKFAQSEGGVDSDLLLAGEADGLFFVGDWVAGDSRVHAALRNGLDIGARVVESGIERS